MTYLKPKTIAEIGCNHKGDMAIAKELIILAKNSGADYAKFQKRNNKLLLPEEVYNSPHPNPANSYGETYGAHREFLEFSLEQHKELMQFCKDNAIGYSTSVWDTISAQEIISLNPDFIKVPSACNTNQEMLTLLKDTYKGDIHISLGMTSAEEIQNIFDFFKDSLHRLVIYICTSGYPVPCVDICLLEIRKLDSLKDKLKGVGFSGHHLGISVDIAAYTLGAEWIERHFTKDRSWKGTEHQASLEPQPFRLLVINLNDVYDSLTYKKEDILDIEKPQRKKLKYLS